MESIEVKKEVKKEEKNETEIMIKFNHEVQNDEVLGEMRASFSQLI